MRFLLVLLLGLPAVSARALYLEGFKQAKDPASLFASAVYRYHANKLSQGNAVPKIQVQRETIKAVLKNAPLFWKGARTEKAYYMMYAQTLSEGEGFQAGNVSDPSFGPNCITLAEAAEVCLTYNRVIPPKHLLVRELETNFDLNYFVLAGTMTIRFSRYQENLDYFPRAIAGYKYGDARAADLFRSLNYSNSRIRGLKPIVRFEKKLSQLLALRDKLLEERKSHGSRPARKGSKGHNTNPRRTTH